MSDVVQESMRSVKSRLQKQRGGGSSSFGLGGMQRDQARSTPYLVALSSDPLLHLAVRVFVPTASTLLIGRGRAEGETEGESDDNDLQLAGLGIENHHCRVRHEAEGMVRLVVLPGAACYVNGSPVSAEAEGVAEGGVELHGGDRVVLGVCSHVFCFVDPRLGLLEGEEAGQEERLSSHDQAIREVVLGRVETRREKEVRLATLVRTLHIACCCSALRITA